MESKQFYADKDWHLYPRGLNFNALEKITVDNNAKLDLHFELTIIVWIYRRRPGDQVILSKSSPDGKDGYGLGVDDTYLIFLGSSESGIHKFSSSPIPLKFLEWQHVACTVSRKQIKLYIDGYVVATGEPNGNILPSPHPLCIGSSPVKRPTNGMFSGRMAQLSLWNIALTDEQILESYKSSWLMHRPPGLVLYFPFLKSRNKNLVTDFSGNKLFGNRSFDDTGVIRKLKKQTLEAASSPINEMSCLPWEKKVHRHFPAPFRKAVVTLLMLCQKKQHGEYYYPECVLVMLPKEVLFLVIRFMALNYK